MRILSLHNLYRIRGGEDESREAEERLLRSWGHEVEVYEETNDPERMEQFSSWELAMRTVWSRESYQVVRQKLQESMTDIVHVQNFFPLLSPSVYYAAQELGVPVVQSLRNYRLICPNGLFFRDGRVCEDCLGQFIPITGVIHACYRESRKATAVTAAMLTVHRFLSSWTKQVNLFIALSEFARQKFITAGFPGERILVKPNFVHPDPGLGEGRGGYALYVGRLSVEKGLDVLLKAWEKCLLPLKIIGSGPQSELVIAAASKSPVIEWLGRRPIKEVYDWMGGAQFLIFPSEWYETFGRVAVEAFAKGTPVIASKIGAIAELVEDGYTGFHFNPSDGDDLAAKVDYAISHPDILQRMRANARAEYLSKYTAEQNYTRLMEIYKQAMRHKQ